MSLVLCTGCFDVLHVGHLYHLEAARQCGDHLVVGITADAFISKGPGRPVFPEERRAELVRALRIVDRTIVYSEPVPLALIRMLRPDVYVKGKEYEGRLPEQALVESLGGRVVFTDTPVYSSTKILETLCTSA